MVVNNFNKFNTLQLLKNTFWYAFLLLALATVVVGEACRFVGRAGDVPLEDGDAGLSVLAETRRWPDLRTLTVFPGSIGPDGGLALARATQLAALARTLGTSAAQLALQWVLANPVITSPIVGASRPEQLVDALAAERTPLDPALKAQLDELTHTYRYGDAPR